MFVLDMFPYPSGTGLHVGHPLGFIGTDIYSRYKRMTGYNVMYTMGFDAFGLPAEQYAVQTGAAPGDHDRTRTSPTTAGNCAGWVSATTPRRSVSTTDPGYYRWTQWIFLQIFNSWYDDEAGRARPIGELVDAVRVGTSNRGRRSGVGRAVPGRTPHRDRRPSSGVRQ